MKNVLFVKGSQLTDGEPIKKDKLIAYERLFLMGKERGLRMAWVSFDDFDGHNFSQWSGFDKGKWKRNKNPIRPNFIIDRSCFNFDRLKIKRRMMMSAPYLNPVQIQMITGDKLLTHLIFPEITQKSHLVHNINQLKEILKKIKSRRVVIKSPYGFGGKRVNIYSRRNCLKHHFSEPMIVQSFIDSSKGISGLVNGVHDLRLVFLAHKLVDVYLRIPPKGQLISNLARGGKRIYLRLSDVPKQVKKMAGVVQKRLSGFENAMYSVDFIYDQGKYPVVIEMNNNPTFEMTPGHEKELDRFYGKFLDHVEKFI